MLPGMWGWLVGYLDQWKRSIDHYLHMNLLSLRKQWVQVQEFRKFIDCFRATSHTRPRARDQYTSSTLIGGKGGASPSSLHTTLEGPTEYVKCKVDVKVYMDSYMTSNGSCYMVTWTIFKNHLLELGLTRNWETISLWTFTTIDLFYFIMCEDPHD